MEVRDAVLDDLPAIVAIYNATIASRMVTADLEPVRVEARRAWFDEHSPSHRPIWVATDNDQVIAWLSYSSFHPRAAYDATSEVSVYVAAEHRGQGLGSRLVRRCIEFAPALRITSLVGLIFGHNTPSLRLFEKHGFTHWGHLPRVAVLDGIERDLVIVGRRV